MPKNVSSIPPDPENINQDRAKWAAIAIEAFMQETGTDEEDAICDLLADIGHWCDRHGYTLTKQIERASVHYSAETDAQGTQFDDI